jgi:exopolysaccharide biosynthesis protein
LNSQFKCNTIIKSAEDWLVKKTGLMNNPVLQSLVIHLLCFSAFSAAAGQAPLSCQDSIRHIQFFTDTLYQSPQKVNFVCINKGLLREYHIDVAYESSGLLKTSQFARNEKAIAAINGSFFDMNVGGSVSYFEKNDSVISKTRPSGEKWAVADSILNAAIVLHRDSGLLIEYARTEQFYDKSDREYFVLVSGPLLIKDSIPQKLPDMNFTLKRHPRTCLGITGESLIFITIDGRSELAAGMNLMEVQDFLLSLGCLDAINLDGGGSTSMWIKDRGIVNEPSDKTGERPVANSLLILKQ